MLPFSRSFLSQTRNLVHFRETQIRVFSSSRKKDVFTGEIPPEDEPPKPKYTKKTKDQQLKINLVDIKGTILGLKTRHEAQMIAKKNNWILVEDDSTKKIPSMRLVDPRVKQIKEVHLEENDEEICDADSVGVGHKSHNKKMPQKQMIFNAKITEHDLRVKLNHIKKWVATGHETIVRASSNFDCLEKIVSFLFLLCFLFHLVLILDIFHRNRSIKF